MLLLSLLQFVREFAKLGLTRSVGGVLALALARELTPVVTAIILAGRVGSAFAAELGTMQVSRRGTADGSLQKQIDARCAGCTGGLPRRRVWLVICLIEICSVACRRHMRNGRCKLGCSP
jgi:hypothetical protein